MSLPPRSKNSFRTSGTSSVPPGSQYTFSFTVTAPSTVGSYNFQWEMVQDGVSWFGDASPWVQVSVINTFTLSPLLYGINFVGNPASVTYTLTSYGGQGIATYTSNVPGGYTVSFSPASGTASLPLNGQLTVTLTLSGPSGGCLSHFAVLPRFSVQSASQQAQLNVNCPQ